MNKAHKQSPVATDEAERMRRGASRLEELLRDPGPGITVTPVAGRPPSAQAEMERGSERNAGPGRDDAVGSAAVASNEGVGSAALGSTPPASGAAPSTTQEQLQARLKTALRRKPGIKPRDSQSLSGTNETSGRTGLSGPRPDKKLSAHTAPPRPSQSTAQADPSANAPQPAQPAPTQTNRLQTSAPARTSTAPQAPSVSPVAPTTPAAASLGKRKPELAEAFSASRDAFLAAGLFSFVINVLMLAGPLFMLQVYDRVMTSGSVPTLVALSFLTAGAYAVIGILEFIRSRVIVRVGMEIDGRISNRVFDAAMRRSVYGPAHTLPALRELDALRQFLSGPGPASFFDAPWTPVYLLVIFLMHWSLGVAATVGAAVLITIAWLSEVRSRQPILEAGKAAGKSFEIAETGQRNAEALLAMGMTRAFHERWQATNRVALGWQMAAADRLGGTTAASKSLRLLLQSMMLAIGAALALNGQVSAGVIVAATIIFGRALAPVEQSIAHWRSFLKVRDSYAKLDELLQKEPPPPRKTSLPEPQGHLATRSLRVAAPQSKQLILANVTFDVQPGQLLAVIGPSASGKSSLVRALVGLWPPASGSITLDGSRLDQWESSELGRYVGYLPQAVELFDGTVKENIARFRTDGDDAAVITAAKQAHAHDLILGLPNGYDTQLGAYGTHLSAGQRQRVALARALYGNPKLIVLDEPNANLDREGDLALTATMQGCRARGQAVVLVSHRVQAISTADLLVYIDKGLQRAFGPRDEVLAKIQSDQLEPTIDRRVSDRRRTSNGGSNIAQDGERRRGGRRKEDRMSAGSPTASSPEPSEG